MTARSAARRPARFFLGLLLVATAAAPAGATTHYIDGSVETVSGPPRSAYIQDDFSSSDSRDISDSADYLSFGESGVFQYSESGHVYSAGLSGFARVSATSSFYRNYVYSNDPDDYSKVEASGSVRIVIDDMIVNGPGSGTVSTSINLHLSGLVHAATTVSMAGGGPLASAAVFASVSIFTTTGQDIGQGSFKISANNGVNTTEDFGWLTGFDGDASLTTSTFDAPLNTPFTVTLTLSVITDAWMLDQATGRADADADFDSTFSFSTDRPVFNLPAGYSANSASTGVVNNTFVAVPEPSAGMLMLTGLAGLGLLMKCRPRR